MVSIRLQRTGRRHQARFRMIVQDSKRAPTSGRVIANLGFYNPHTKEHGVDLEKAKVYLEHGAQPSSRVVKFLISQDVDLPKWVTPPSVRQKAVKNPSKLRRHAPEAPLEEKVEEKAKAQSEKSEASPASTDKNKVTEDESTQESTEVQSKPETKSKDDKA